MLHLVRGDENNLEGRVILFSKPIGFSERNLPKYVAIYSAVNPFDFFEKVGLPKEEAAKMEKSDAEAIEDAKNALPPEAKVTTWYSTTPKFFADDDNIFSGNEDLLDAGSYNGISACVSALYITFQLYQLRYTDQLLLKQGQPTYTFANKTQPEDAMTYSQFKQQDQNTPLKQYMLANFVVPLSDAYGHGNPVSATQLDARLRQFSIGAPFAKDILTIADLIKQKANPRLINLYLDKINAVHEEDYMNAAKLKKQIEQVLTEQPK